MQRVYITLILLFAFFTSVSSGQTVKILFDASKAEAAGNADWIVDADAHNLGYSSGPAILNNGTESNPQKIPTTNQSSVTASTPETFWSGALSYWAIDCAKRNYIVETLPYNGQITYGNSSNTQDLSNYKVFVVCEPNILFSASEKTAILNFVLNGGGLMMISDHTISDRNNDGEDSPFIWNDLMSNNTIQANPFGITFDLADFSQTTSNIPSLPSDSILQGPAGTVTQAQWSNGTSMTLNPTANSTVKGVIYKTGSAFGNTNVMAAYARFGNGKVAAIGDSSPCDDGTGDPNDVLFNGYTGDASGNHKKLLMNMVIWLATTSGTSVPVAGFSASTTSLCPGQSTVFTNSSSGTVNSYAWNFGSGATPSSATTVGPHTVSYSTSGLKTVTLTVSNSNGSNTMTRTDYINVSGSCATTDAGVLALLSPASMNCPASAVPIQVQVKNYGTSNINLVSTPITITLTAKNPAAVTESFTQIMNSGTFTAGSSVDVTFSSVYNMLLSGDYIFNASTSMTGDALSTNNAMVADTVNVGPGFQSDIAILSEDMGIVSATTTIPVHETNNGFANVNLTMSGTADVRLTVPSSTYSTASGGANVFFTNTSGRFFLISGINTMGYSNLQLYLGMLKSTVTAQNELSIQVSTDGTNFTNLTYSSPTTANAWTYITTTGNIPATANLRLKFTQTSTSVQFRIDDLLLVEHVTTPSISITGNTTFCQGGSVSLTSTIASSYLWSNGETTQSINANSSGNYSVILTNAIGCTASAGPVSVNVNPVYSIPLTRYIAHGSAYTLPNGQVVTTAGTYTSSLLTSAGCDSSIVTTLVLVNASDNSLCTTDSVNLLTGTVTHTAINTNDGNPCTIDGCDPLTGVYHIPATEICGNGIDDNCNGLIDESCPVTLSVKVYIEGFYKSGTTMAAVANPTSFPTVCDTVTVELHATVSPFGLLFSDKKTIDINGNGTFSFPTARAFSYYIVVKHRNSLDTWSASPVLMNATNITYNFSDAINKAFGSNQKLLATGIYGIISGDTDKNGAINTTDLSAIETKAASFSTGYLVTDLNGDRVVEAVDYSLVENNLGLLSLHP